MEKIIQEKLEKRRESSRGLLRSKIEIFVKTEAKHFSENPELPT
jgi:hypothetical protein